MRGIICLLLVAVFFGGCIPPQNSYSRYENDVRREREAQEKEYAEFVDWSTDEGGRVVKGVAPYNPNISVMRSNALQNAREKLGSLSTEAVVTTVRDGDFCGIGKGYWVILLVK